MPDDAQDAMTETAQDATSESTTEQDSRTGFDALPEETKAEIRKLRREAAGYRKEVEAAKAEQVKRDEAEATKRGEWEKVATERADRIADLERQIADRDRQDRKRAAGRKHNLPDELVDRLTGETDDDLEADAKALAKLVGTREAPETDADKRTATRTTTKKQGDVLTSYEFGKRQF